MDCVDIINKYYDSMPELKSLLLRHSRDVADEALRIVDAHPQWHADRLFVEQAAMLHDIGIFLCHAPSIGCHGTYPYILHGIRGAEILRAEGLPLHARVAERHTGSGITLNGIDYFPQSIEEKIICYADKFYSKSHPYIRSSEQHIREKMAHWGDDSLARWDELTNLMK